MRVLQTINSMDPRLGGPSSCTLDMMQGLFDIGANVDLLTVKCKEPEIHNLGEGSSWLKEVDNDCWSPLGLSMNLKQELSKSNYDVYHANTLWLYQSHLTSKVARLKKKPYIISPHGMLYPNALQIKRWKKVPMLKLWFNRDVMQATCLHATCQQEAEYCRQFGYKGPIAVIPNAVVFPKGVEIKKEIYRDQKDRRQIGFLGRLHPIKKVENVIYAIDKLSDVLRGQISFQIIGKYDDRYEQWLKEEVRRLHLEDIVEFVGFVSGMAKYNNLKKLSALFVPSESENFGMIVPESLICGTPVYASLGTPWGELIDCNAGWWKDNSPETVAEVIKDVLSKSDMELLEMGINGRHLIEEKYEQHKVAADMLKLYEWICYGGIKPEFVYNW